MSSPRLRCSLVAILSSRSEHVARLHTDSSIGSRCLHSSVALRSGKRITSRPSNTCMASPLKHPCIPPVASQMKSGMKWAATSAVFSLSTMATGLADMAAELSDSRCSPNRHCFILKSGSFLTECTQLTWLKGSLTRCPVSAS